MFRRVGFLLLVPLLGCSLVACGWSRCVTESTLRVEDGGFITVTHGSFRPPETVNSYSHDGRLLDTRYFDSFHHQEVDKDTRLMMLASVRTDKILRVKRNGEVKIFSLPLKFPYDTYISINKAGHNRWAVSLNGPIFKGKENKGAIWYFDEEGKVLERETVPHYVNYFFVPTNPNKDMVLIQDKDYFTNYKIVYTLGKKIIIKRYMVTMRTIL